MSSEFFEEINGSDFDSKIISGTAGLKIVKFWAPWCGPCKSFGPTAEEVAKEILSSPENQVKFFKANIDDHSLNDICAKHNVRGVPMCLAFKNGERIGDKVGMISKKYFEEWVQEMLKK